MKDLDAIVKAYPNVTKCNSKGAWDKDGKAVTIVESDVTAARVTLNNEAAAVQYQKDRVGNHPNASQDTIYPSIGDQLDLLYKDIVAGTVTTSGGFATAIKATKDKYPKP